MTKPEKMFNLAAEKQGLTLPFGVPVQEELGQQEVIKEKITYERKKQSTHKGCVALPPHLPVEVEEIYVCIRSSPCLAG